MRVLVVDDEALNRDMLARRLARRGFTPLIASSGGEALVMIECERPDVIVLDVMMPGLSGLDVLEQLRGSGDRTPVIMATALDGSADMVNALDRGADDYVTKPIDFPVLVARILSKLRSRPAPPNPTPEQLELGDLFAGRYRLDEVLGRGTFGTVFRARHAVLGTDVAIKILHEAQASRPVAISRFRREGALASRVRHPNAVQVLDFDVSAGGRPYLVMEFVQGESVAAAYAAHGQFSLAEAGRLVQAMCAVLGSAHACGVIHRDIKPANILYADTAVGRLYKLSDFGIATGLLDTSDTDRPTLDGRIVGTPAFMAPERLRNQPFDGRSDVFSLAVVIYELLSGRLPYTQQPTVIATALAVLTQRPTPLAEVADVPAGVSALIDACLSKVASDRPWPLDLAARWAVVTGGPATDAPAAVPPSVQVESTAPNLEVLAAHVGRRVDPRLLEPDARPVVDMARIISQGIQLDAAEAFMLSQMDGSLTVDELAQCAVGLPPGELSRILSTAWRAGLARLTRGRRGMGSD